MRALGLALLLLARAARAATHHVQCATTAGALTIELRDELAPLGVARFLALVADGWGPRARPPALSRTRAR